MSTTEAVHNPYLHGPLSLVFLRTAAPIILFMTVSGLFTIVDALFLGRFAGSKALTAVTLMFPVMMLMVALQSMVSAGMASIVARKIGAGDMAGAEGAVHAAHLLALVVSAGLMLAFFLLGAPLTRALAAGDAEIAEMGLSFTGIMVVFSPFAFFLNIQGDALRSEGMVGTMALLAIIATVLNMAFNYVLIGVFQFGPAGSAAGSVIAQVLSVAAVVVLRLSGRTRLPLIARGTGSVLGNWRSILVLGAPPSLSFLGISLASGLIIADIQIWSTANMSDTVAAYGVISRILTFAYLPLMGASMACQSIAGNNFGAGLHARVRASLKIGFVFALIYSALFEIAFVALPQPIGELFVDDPAVVAEVVRIMPVMCGAYVLSAPLLIIAGYYQALGMAGSAAVLSLARTYLIGLPLLALVPFALGEPGIWIASPAGDVLMLLAAGGLLAWNVRRRRMDWGLFHREAPATAVA
ncbi:MAG: MATE family efflux transporter [Ancalomicrobiaceae bacterium]|nr:MATE family efflux transporter [Ancalomicrobiaceae bacterium]